jgi:hypothetical protein
VKASEPFATLDCSPASGLRESVPLPGTAARVPIKQASDARLPLRIDRFVILPPFQSAHSKSRLCFEPHATWHAESDQRTTRDVRRDFQAARQRRRRALPRSGQTSIRAPIFSKFAEWGRTGARRRGLCSRARKIRTHCVIIKCTARGLAGFPGPGPPVAFYQRPILCHTMCSYLSEQTCLYFRAVGRFPHRT